MPAPKKAQKPNYKFYMKDDKPILIEPVKWRNRRMVGRDESTKEILCDDSGNPLPYNQINLPNWKN